MKVLIFLALVLSLVSTGIGEDIPIEWDPYSEPTIITGFDVECTNGNIYDNPIPWVVQNPAPLPPTDTTFIVTVSETGIWHCRVTAISTTDRSDVVKGIFKEVLIISASSVRTP